MSRYIELNRAGSALTLSEAIEAVRTEEEIIVTSGGRPVARLLHHEPGLEQLKIGSAKGADFSMAVDFDDDLRDFDDP